MCFLKASLQRLGLRPEWGSVFLRGGGCEPKEWVSPCGYLLSWSWLPVKSSMHLA